jgi:hypothetical protein
MGVGKIAGKTPF